MHNRHRVRATPGLKARLGIAEKTDQELVEEAEEVDSTMELDDDETAVILAQPRITPQVLEVHEDAGEQAVRAFLAGVLAGMARDHRERIRSEQRERTAVLDRISAKHAREEANKAIKRHRLLARERREAELAAIQAAWWAEHAPE